MSIFKRTEGGGTEEVRTGRDPRTQPPGGMDGLLLPLYSSPPLPRWWRHWCSREEEKR